MAEKKLCRAVQGSFTGSHDERFADRRRPVFTGRVTFHAAEPSQPVAAFDPMASPSNLPLVLVAEDDPLIRMAASYMLTDSGFRTVEAANGDEALQILRTRRDVDAVLTDIEMPGSIDGLEFARAAREEFPRLTVVVVSGRLKPKAGDLPSDTAFFSKPFEDRLVVESLRGALLRSPSRLAALRETQLLDSAPEAAFDRITRLVCRCLHADVCLISLVDTDRQFFKSSSGLQSPWREARETPLTHSFCQYWSKRGMQWSYLTQQETLSCPLTPPFGILM